MNGQIPPSRAQKGLVSGRSGTVTVMATGSIVTV
jgi:hypothetical protein